MGGSGGAPGAALAGVAPEAAGAVPDRVVAGEMPADEDAKAGAGAAARLFGQLEGHAIGGDDIVAAHDAFLLEAEHLLEVDAAERDKGGRRVGGRPTELVVEGGESRRFLASSPTAMRGSHWAGATASPRWRPPSGVRSSPQHARGSRPPRVQTPGR